MRRKGMTLVEVMLVFGFVILALASIVLGILPAVLHAIRIRKATLGEVDYGSIARFCICYIPARALGTLVGLVKQS